MSTVCVVGLGYIGLPVAAMLASKRHTVIGCDVKQDVVDTINEGHAHFFEPELDILLAAAVQTGRFKAQTTPAPADCFIIAVPTPFMPDREPDLRHVEAATTAIAPHLRNGAIVILESTSPVGTTEKIADQLRQLRPDLSFPEKRHGDRPGEIAIAHCPERILPGQMLQELVNNDRVIGGVTLRCAARAKAFYKTFVQGSCFLTDCRTAELVKLVENASRDVNIAFVNEISVICERLGVDVWETIELANKHPRVSLLRPGAGVGGHCIAVDPWFIVAQAQDQARLIRTAREVNDAKPHFIVDRILKQADRFKTPTVACMGLAYKPDVEDIRQSPAVEIVRLLAKRSDIEIVACDPFVQARPAAFSGMPNVTVTTIEDALEKADVVAFLVGHAAFKTIDPSRLSAKIIVDDIGLFARRSRSAPDAAA